MKDMFVDCGAHVGDTVAAALEMGYDDVYAFEPHPESFRKLQERYAVKNVYAFEPHPESLCKFDDRRAVKTFNRDWYPICCVRSAVSASSDNSAWLRLRPDNSEGHSICAKNDCRGGMLVPNTRLSEWLYKTWSDYSEPLITLKLDVEGAEYEILEDLAQRHMLGTIVCKVYVEWHWNRIGMTKKKHRRVVKMVNSFGLSLTGRNAKDEFGQL